MSEGTFCKFSKSQRLTYQEPDSYGDYLIKAIFAAVTALDKLVENHCPSTRKNCRYLLNRDNVHSVMRQLQRVEIFPGTSAIHRNKPKIPVFDSAGNGKVDYDVYQQVSAGTRSKYKYLRIGRFEQTYTGNQDRYIPVAHITSKAYKQEHFGDRDTPISIISTQCDDSCRCLDSGSEEVTGRDNIVTVLIVLVAILAAGIIVSVVAFIIRNKIRRSSKQESGRMTALLLIAYHAVNPWMKSDW